MDFFIEELGGFTNSLVREFTHSTNISLSNSQRKNSSKVKMIQVDVTTIDVIVKELRDRLDFIKIDVEGAELDVLQGAKATLSRVNGLMVEVSRNHKEVYELLYSFGFKATDKGGSLISTGEYPSGNIFYIR